MYTIDLILKYTPVPLSVQRKSEEDARELYQQFREAMNSGEPKVMEFISEDKSDKAKTICIATSELIAVQMSQKGAASDGRQPGFFIASEA
ncbi:hypothetical protein AY599_03610 [Leptolyngbya valderiana BDU 20041]|nr:hypothetical protein [Geitlerinema sp. CS-897]OAB62362.1 hypothetical protein AY599_03610 [Leptolyngbya valderiana BDU 20041]